MSTTSTAALIYLLANQMCPTYPTNQSDSLKIDIGCGTGTGSGSQI